MMYTLLTTYLVCERAFIRSMITNEVAAIISPSLAR